MIRLARLPGRLGRDRRGAALIEFAFSLPIVLLMGLGGLEVAHFGLANLRVSQIAMTTADNAGRVRDQINEGDINELMTGAKFVGNGIDFAAHGRIILSSVEPNGFTDSRKGYYIRWQRCTGLLAATSSYGAEGAGKTDSSIQYMGPATNRIVPATDTAMMFVEVVYEYQPIVGNSFVPYLKNQTIRSISAFNVRQRQDQVLKTGSVAEADIKRCNRFAA